MIGLGLVGFGLFEADFDVGALTDFSIIEVPIDPTTGAILGTIKLGAPDVKPFERSGTILTPTGLGTCWQDVDPNIAFDYQIQFGRQLSGDRNISPIWHGYNQNCAYAYMEWDLVDIPNSFVATSVRFQLKLTDVFSDRSQNGQCGIMHIEQSFNQIGERNIAQRQIDSQFGRPASTNPIIADPMDFWVAGQNVNFGTTQGGQWCQTVGIKTFNWGKQTPDSGGRPAPVPFDIQHGVDAFNRALTDGQDKFTVLIVPLGGRGTGTTWALDYEWWKTNGSFLIEGTSDPIRCDIGFNQVNFRCVPIVCDLGDKLNQSTNECETITCEAGETLQFTEATVCPDVIGIQCTPLDATAVCTPIECNVGERLVGSTCEQIICEEGTKLVGSSCDPLFCGEGFEITGNQCTVIPCPIGEELVGGSCQQISCPTNTKLIGNDCIEITCGAGQILIDNQCENTSTLPTNATDPIVCNTGFEAVGNICLPIELDCPAGTEAFENVCVQRIPDLLTISGIEPSLFLITGLVIVGMSGVGIVARRRG